jgi:hypothetical protein
MERYNQLFCFFKSKQPLFSRKGGIQIDPYGSLAVGCFVDTIDFAVGQTWV